VLSRVKIHWVTQKYPTGQNAISQQLNFAKFSGFKDSFSTEKSERLHKFFFSTQGARS